MKNKLVPWKKREVRHEPQWDDHPFHMLHQEINDRFEHLLHGPGRLQRRPGNPGLEVSETDAEIRVKAELPGMDEKDIQVSVQENMLTIRGEHREEKEEKKRRYHVSEMHYGSYSRTIPLPSEVDAGKARARFKRGVLTLTLPKTEEAKTATRQIPVHAA